MMTENIKDIVQELSAVIKKESELSKKVKAFCVSVLKAFYKFGPADKSKFLVGDEFDEDRLDYTGFCLKFDNSLKIEFYTEEGWQGKSYWQGELIGTYSFDMKILEFSDNPEIYFQSEFGLGEELYKVYGDSAGWKNFSGNDMPDWSELPEEIKTHWRAVAIAKLSAPERAT